MKQLLQNKLLAAFSLFALCGLSGSAQTQVNNPGSVYFSSETDGTFLYSLDCGDANQQNGTAISCYVEDEANSYYKFQHGTNNTQALFSLTGSATECQLFLNGDSTLPLVGADGATTEGTTVVTYKENSNNYSCNWSLSRETVSGSIQRIRVKCGNLYLRGNNRTSYDYLQSGAGTGAWWTAFTFTHRNPAPMKFKASSQWATYSTDNAALIPEGIRAFYPTKCDGKKDSLILTEMDTIPANTGVLLYRTSTTESDYVVTPTTAPDPTAISEKNLLKATGYAGTTLSSVTNCYGLSGGTFKKLTFNESDATKNKVAKFKAYLEMPTDEASSATTLQLQLPEGITEDIHTAKLDEAQKDANAVYDLTGRKVNHMGKGEIYIQSGKKFIAK